MESSSLTGSSKRAKAPGNAVQVANCSVDGCNADLSQCREYHRRHKVCELHSKTAKVTVGGRELRFCQQCSRFHSLTEFDEGKRSCRKRLDGHNKRRRKPQPDSLNKTSGILYSPTHQGAKLLQFGSSQIFPSAVGSSAWSGVIKAENEMALYSSQSQFDYKETNQFQFLQGSERILPEASISQPHISPSSASSGNTSRQRVFPGGYSDRALSLLSPSAREIGFSHMVQPDPSLHYEGLTHYSFSSQQTETKPGGVSDAAAPSTGFHFHEPDGSSATASHQTLMFRWE